MEIRVLGPLEVFGGDGAIEVRRPRERALLTMLACEPGRVASTDRLIDGLWGDSSPATATKTLQTYVHHLRTLLPKDVIVTEGPGYRLAIDSRMVDSEHFLSEIYAARAVGADDPATEALRLESALSRWRGVPFLDAGDADWVRPHRSRLEAARLQAQIDLADARLRSGRAAEVISELRSLVDEHPLREDLWGLYMRALYRAGRQADALRAYSEARRLLVDELGIDPSSQLQQLEERILRQDPSLLGNAVGEPQRREPGLPTDAVDWSGEQRLVTVLKAEISGTDALAAAAGAEVSGRAAAELIHAIETIAEGFGGSPVRTNRSEVVAVFGAPVAREDDTYQALRTALQFREEAAAYGREIQRAWRVDGPGLRVAVVTMPMTLPVDFDVSGGDAPLNRLLARGDTGSVVVDDHSRKLMGDLFDWEPIDDDGEAAWKVRGTRQRADKARWGRRLHAPLIGRDRELAELSSALESLTKGIGGVVLLSGEAGVGKTRLVADARQQSGDAVAWLAGHCVSFAEANPYWPFRDMFRSWLAVGIDDTDLQVRLALHDKLESSAGKEADELYPYLGGLLGIALEAGQAQRLQLSSEALQYRTFEVVGTVLGRLAEKQPVAVVVEDLHWADSTSTQLLDQLLSLCERQAVLLILTSRPAPDHPTRRLQEAARRRYPHRLHEIHLEGLAADAQRGMLAALVGSESLPSRAVDKILMLAEGNPFYLEELVGSLIDQGTLVASETGWELRDAEVNVPETVEKVVQARIDSLDPPAHRLLTAASVLGRSFGLPLLQGVVGESAEVIKAVEALLRLDLLVEARRWPYAEYLFRHVLIQEAAYRTIPAERRIVLHRRAAEWLERRHERNPDEVMSQLAVHWKEAGDEDKAVTALMRAGDLARRDHALDEAVDHYRVLLPLLERRGDRQAMALVLLKLAHALHQSLRFEESNDVYQRAFEVWDYEPSPEPTRTLRFRGPPFFRPPDPVRSYHLTDIQLQMALFDRLVERWPDDTLVPSLAERWEISADGLRYEFRLRAGLEWSDGVPLTAHDVEYGIKRNLDPQRPGVSVAMFYVIEGAKDYALGRSDDLSAVGVTALDDMTVEFRLIRPAPYLLGMLNRPDSGPQPRHSIEALGDDWVAVPNEVISGAFRRRTHTDQVVVLERRPEYQGSRRGNVRVVERGAAPSAENLEAYLAGEVDLSWMGALWSGRGLDQVAEPEVWVEPPAGLSYLVFNFRTGRVNDRVLRLALAHAVDREALAEKAPGHVRVATGGIVPPFLAGHTPDIAPRFDPDLSRRLLGSAAVPESLRVLRVSTPDTWMETGVVLDNWRQHLNVDFDVVETDSFLTDHHDIDIFYEGWYPGYTDPEYFLRLLLHSEAADNFGRFANERYDELVEQACAAREERPRLALFHEADRLAVAEEVAVIPLSYSGNISLRRPGVEGWWEHGKSWANFADLTLP